MGEFELRFIELYTSRDGLAKSHVDKLKNAAQVVVRLEYNLEYMSYLSTSEDVKAYLTQVISVSGSMSQGDLEVALVKYLPSASIRAIKKIASEILNETAFIMPNASQADYINLIAYIFGQLCIFYKSVLDGSQNHSIYTEGELNVYDIHSLYILSKLGNNVTGVDLAYNKDKYANYNNIKLIDCSSLGGENGSMTSIGVSKLNDITLDDVIEIIHCRAAQNPCLLHVIGEDLACRLVQTLGEVKAKTPENLLLLEDGIDKPTYDEVNSVPRIQVSSVEQLIKRINWNMFAKKKDYSDRAVQFIQSDLQKQNFNSVGKAMNRLVGFICLYNRYDITKSTVLCYGTLDTLSNAFVSFLALCGKTVVIIDVSDNNRTGNGVYIDNGEWTHIKLDTIVDDHPYPSSLVQGTIAYGASAEMNKVLYNGETLGLYRTRQYQTCDIATLHTTFDELKLLWDKEVTVRPSFNTTNNGITVPVVYAKVLGWTEDYIRILSELNTEHTIVAFSPSEVLNLIQDGMQINHFADINGTSFKEQIPMYKNGSLDINAIMKYRTFKYRMLDIGVQKHILSKISQLIEDDLINHSEMPHDEFIDIVLNTTLNLGERYQQELQWHDFTKQNPKLIVLCQDMTEIGLQESIIITLLHLCGWDIVIMIPTGYNITGRNLKTENMQQHIIGENKFNTGINMIPPIDTFGDSGKKKGFFSKLFGID